MVFSTALKKAGTTAGVGKHTHSNTQEEVLHIWK
jgi:hypothetical protein